MNAAIIVVAGIAGAVIGYLLGYISQKKATGLVEEKLNESQLKYQELKTKSSSEVEKNAAKSKELEKKLTVAEKKVAELQKSQQAELAKLGKQVQEANDANSKLAAQAEAQLSGRQQAEGRLKQIETQAAQAQKSLELLQAKLQQAEGQLAAAHQTAERRNQEIQKLRADVASSRGSDTTAEEAMIAFADVDGSMEGILGKLMEIEQLNAAVLADSNGLPIVAVGDAGIKDGMAATAQLIGSIAAQLQGLVKFNSLRAYVLQDAQNNVIAGRAFVTAGEPMGLTTFSQRPPGDRMLDSAMANLISAIE